MVYLFSLFMLLHQPKPINNLSELRSEYHLAIYKEEAANDLDKHLKAINNKTPIQTGYLGATKMLLAKFAYWPNTKYALFVEGKTFLESAIRLDPKNLELLYLRYSIQLNSPDFLGYSQNKESDRKILIDQVKLIGDKDLKNRITVFLVNSAKLSEAERKSIQ